MSPLDKARLVYTQEPCARTFEEDLRLHLQFGYVFSTPEFFVMGRPVDRHAPYDQLTDPRLQFPEPDAWWVYLAAGDFIKIWTISPYNLSYIGWERDNRPRFYRVSQLFRTCQRLHTSTISAVQPTTRTTSSPGD